MNCRGINKFTGAVAVLCVGFAGMCAAADEASAKPAEKPAISAPAAVATVDNLKAAYLTSSAAKQQYIAFAAKARAEGYKSVEVLFHATIVSQGVMIKKYAVAIRKLNGTVPDFKEGALPAVKSTKENLEAALAADIGEKNTRYADFAKQAEAEKNTGAMYAFKGAVAAETEYAKFFKQALAELDGWKAEGKTFAVCEVCSFLVMGPPPATCPVCSAPKDKFAVIK